jgi:dUTP pyrophosphatase
LNVLVKYRVKPEFADLAPPAYASDGAAGADLRAAVGKAMTVAPGARAVVPTGLVLANGVGTIDADYRGEVGVVVVNLGAEPVTIGRGDRIAQLVVAPVARAVFEPAGALAGTARGAGGFGSTGKA